MSSHLPKLCGELKVPGDKSISHRALIFAALSKGNNRVFGLSPAADCLSTAECLRRLGMVITRDEASDWTEIESFGLQKLKCPAGSLDAGNSGTTIRLLSGLVAGQPFTTQFDGDSSLRQRPMSRVLEPLQSMGATIEYFDRQGYPPFSIVGGNLKGLHYEVPVASAQVQTALVLAGLQAEGETIVQMPLASAGAGARDHTARQFRHLGVPFDGDGTGKLRVKRLLEPLEPFSMQVPGDISSAAFFMVAAASMPGSAILLTGVGINPGRNLVIDVLRKMGADIELQNSRQVCGEPVADISVKGNGRLNGATIGGDIIAAGIDEIPILALAGSLCDGTFKVSGASELRVKESDRLKAIVTNLEEAGADISEQPDGFEIRGRNSLPGGSHWKTEGDHRLAMTGLIANLIVQKPLAIDDAACVNISYPQFKEHLQVLLG